MGPMNQGRPEDRTLRGSPRGVLATRSLPGLILLAVLVLVVAGCGTTEQPAEVAPTTVPAATAPTAPATAADTPAEADAATGVESFIEDLDLAPSPQSAPPDGATGAPDGPRTTADVATDIAGTYQITGANPNGTTYQGTMRIQPSGQTYQIVWETGSTAVGTGLVRGDRLTTSYAQEGAPCGIVFYEIGSNGTLDGEWTVQGLDRIATEQAVPADPTTLVGTYEVTGRNFEDSPYTGNLTITSGGAAYQFAWETTAGQFVGTGILNDPFLSVVYGEPDRCGLATYRIGTDGSLDGQWNFLGMDQVVDEQARPAR